MKRAVITLVALVVLCAAAVAAEKAANTYQVTGPVLETRGDVIVVKKGKDVWELTKDANTKVTGDVQKGKTVKIQYKMIATEITVK